MCYICISIKNISTHSFTYNIKICTYMNVDKEKFIRFRHYPRVDCQLILDSNE